MPIALNRASSLAALAEASYANLTGDLFAALTDNNPDFLWAGHLSAMQAVDFVHKWAVVSGGHQPDMPSGFSATVFRGLDEAGDLAGQYVLAIRGTAGFPDVSADGGDIVLDDLGVDPGGGMRRGQFMELSHRRSGHRCWD